MSLPPFLVHAEDGGLGLLALRSRGEERWWWTRGAEHALDSCLAAATGRRWPVHALAARWISIAHPRQVAAWTTATANILREAGLAAGGLVSQLGTPGHYRKHAALVLDERNQAVGVLKCSEAPASRASIRVEAAALAALAGSLPAALPRILRCAEVDGRVLSLQTPVRGRRSRRWTPAHHDLALAMLRAGGGTWDEAIVARERRREALAACGGEAAALATTCGRLLDRACPALGDLPLGWAHRDFTPANVWVGDRDGRPAVIDWEWADPAWAPGHDLIHFHLIDRLRRGEDADAAGAALAEARAPLAAYADALGIGHAPALPDLLAGLYLYDLILFYAAANDAGLARAPDHPLIAAAAALAKRLLAAPPHQAPMRSPSKVQALRE